MENITPSDGRQEHGKEHLALGNLHARIAAVLPAWEAWLEHLGTRIAGFERWRPMAIDELRIASFNLEQGMREHFEGAINALHDLWCLNAWIEMDVDDEEGLPLLRLELVNDLAMRCGRLLSPENLMFLPTVDHRTPSPEQWMEFVASCEFGRSLVMVKGEPGAGMAAGDISENGTRPGSTDLPQLSGAHFFRGQEDELLNAHRRVLVQLHRAALFEQAARILRASPLNACRLIKQQAAAAHRECADRHVPAPGRQHEFHEGALG